MIKKHPLLSFFLITFLITWGIGGLFFLFPQQVTALTMKEADRYHPLFFLAAWAPTLSTFLVILAVRGRQGLVAFWARYLEVARLGWYIAIFAGIVGFGFVLRFLEQAWGMSVPNLPFTWSTFIPFALYWVLSDPGPLGEEGGWRGFALPLLQRRFSPFWASVILGTVWGIWHLPAFFVSTLIQSSLSFLWFFLGAISLTMFMAYAYNATKGNIPLMIVIHWAYNLIGVLLSMNAYFYVANAVLLLVAAFLISRRWPATPVTEPIPGWPRSRPRPPQAEVAASNGLEAA